MPSCGLVGTSWIFFKDLFIEALQNFLPLNKQTVMRWALVCFQILISEVCLTTLSHTGGQQIKASLVHSLFYFVKPVS